MTASIKTLRYLEGFRCIGPDCPDSCCVGWRVSVDEHSYRRLHRAAKKTSSREEKRFKDGMLRQRSNPTPANYAKTRLDGQGRCAFLEADDLCHIHKVFGEACLSETCTFYPRSFSRSDGELMMGATLSCPETARLCLIVPGSTEVSAIGLDRLSRPPLAFRDYDAAGLRPDARYAGLIGSIFDQFIGLADFPLASRLFFVSRLADLLTTALDSEDAEAQIADGVESMADPGLLGQLDAEFSQLNPDPAVAIALIQTILYSRVGDASGGRLKDLLEAVVEIYSQRIGEPLEKWGPSTDQNASKMVGSYIEFRRYWTRHFVVRLDVYWVNFCRNYLLFRGIPDAASPLVYVVHMLVSLVLCRFLLFSHPRLVAAMEDDLAGAEKDAAGALLDEIVVDVVQRLFRELEHNAATAQMISDKLEQRGLLNLAFAAYLIAA